jgi:hypothetical protein
MISAILPNVLPAPVSIDFKMAFGSMPKQNPATIATISNDKNGLTFL